MKNFEFSRGEIRAFRRVTVFRGFLSLYGIFKNNNGISFSYLPRLQTDKSIF